MATYYKGDGTEIVFPEIASPFVASTVAEMTDTNNVYVYTGSESGYTSGNWYYYNGTAWVSGGVYNAVAVNIDTTLTQSGVPADAKITGDVRDNVNGIARTYYDFTSREIYARPEGWRLNESDGLCSANSSYKLVKYAVTEGEAIKVVCDDRFQFQNSASVPSNGTNNRLGITYGAYDGVLIVPSGATYLIMSTTIANGTAECYSAEAIVNSIVKQLAYTETSGFIQADGSIGDAGSYQAVYTSLIDVSNSKVNWHLSTPNATAGQWVAYASYTEEGAFISRTELYNASSKAPSGTINIPNNVKYIAFTYRTYGTVGGLTVNAIHTFDNIKQLKSDIEQLESDDIERVNNLEAGVLPFDESNMQFGDRYTPDPTTINYARNIVTNKDPIAIKYTTQIVANGDFPFRVYRCTDTGSYITNSDSGWVRSFTVYAGEYIYIKILDNAKTTSEWTTVELCLEHVYMIQPWSYNTGRENEVDQIVPNDECYCTNNTIRRIYNPYKTGGSMTLTGQLHCHVKQASGTDGYTSQDLADKLYELGYDFFTITDYARFGITPPPSDLHDMVWLCNSYEANYGPSGSGHGDDVGEHMVTWNVRSIHSKQNTNYTNIQEVIDWCHDNNAIPSFPHPFAVDSTVPQPVTKASKIHHGLRFVEVYNGASIQAHSSLLDDYSCEDMWKALLKQGNFIFAMGTSDSHDLLDYQCSNGVVKVFANAKNRKNIMASLLEGNFYVSSYVDYSLQGITVDDGEYTITTGWDSATVTFFDENGNVLQSSTGNVVTYKFTGTERLVWARVEWPSPTYARFWTQPVFFIDKMYD